MVTVTQEFIDIITANKATAKMYTPSQTGGNVAKTVLTVGMSVTKSTIEISVPTGYEIQVATFRDDYGFETSYTISSSKLIATTKDNCIDVMLRWRCVAISKEQESYPISVIVK